MTETEQTPHVDQTPRSVTWLAAYVYGTIATLVAIGGLTFEKRPNPVSSTGVIVVGAVAIWLAHAASQLVGKRAREQSNLHVDNIVGELRRSWPIVSAALPAATIMVIACFGVWTASTGLVIDEVLGVVALAVVGFATSGGSRRSLVRRVIYVTMVIAVGLVVVGLELVVHLL